MRTKLFVAVAALFLFALSLYVPREASAIPGFARQTGMACNSCHFQHFPTLNAFGRAFKAGGYTMAGGQSLIEGDFLSLPSALNASISTKIRFQKTNGADDSAEPTNKGELQFPDEAALLIGGRVGENIGFLLETMLTGVENQENFASFKMPFTYTIGEGTKVAAIPFTTDSQGAAYGYELFSTGALRMIRPGEHRQETSAQQFLGTGTAATGIAFVVQRELYYANYTAWAPNMSGSNAAGPYLHYARLAFTPTYAGWALGAGVQWWGGTGKSAPDEYVKADAWAIDAQAQGNVGSLPVGVYLSYGNAAKTDAGETANIFNASGTDDNSAFSTLVEVGVIPGRLTVNAGFLAGDTSGSVAGMNDNTTTAGSQTAVTLGANYQLAQNVQLVWNSSFYGGDSFDANARGDQLHTAMIFAAF